MKCISQRPTNYILAKATVLISSVMFYFFGSALTEAEPLGNYLNKRFPAEVSVSQRVPYESAFPNLTFDLPLTLNEDLLTNRLDKFCGFSKYFARMASCNIIMVV